METGKAEAARQWRAVGRVVARHCYYPVQLVSKCYRGHGRSQDSGLQKGSLLKGLPLGASLAMSAELGPALACGN